MPDIIIIYRKDSTVQACLKDMPDVWRTGKNEIEAVGNLLWYEREKFGVNIMPLEDIL